MKLSDYIAGIAKKRLVQVDLPEQGSHQHELNGVVSLKSMLGDSKRSGDITWNYLGDSDTDLREDGDFTFYDARDKHPTRSEWRFYYSDNIPLNGARVDDLLALLQIRGEPSDRLHGIIFQADTPWARRAEVLFGSFGETFQARDQASLSAGEVRLAEQTILELLGLSAVAGLKTAEDLVAEHFPEDSFPKTLELAQLAWKSLEDVKGAGADELLERYLARESEIFYALERRIVGKKITQPKAFSSVEEFLAYSLTVQNRRKSRMGFSFEHHLHAVLKNAGLKFDHPGRTEGKSRPDFLFPGNLAYQDRSFDAAKLRMLAAKSTCKDRWRQALAEAARIPTKHLCTLEPAISEDQTAEMLRQNVVLVVPRRLHTTFSAVQQGTLMDLESFIREVRSLQS